MKKLFTFIALVLSISAYAQKKAVYETKNSINIGIGGTFSAFDISEFHGHKVFTSGMTFNLDYTRFLSKHWGIYLEGGLSGSSASKKNFQKTIAKLDKGDFTYSSFKIRKEYPGDFAAEALIGAVYRYNIGNWSIRPRLGAGIAEYYQREYRYYRTDIASSEGLPQAVIVQPEKNTHSIRTVEPAVKAEIEFLYYLARHFHIGAELGVTGYISRQDRYVSISNTEKSEFNAGSALLYYALFGPLWMELYTPTDTVYEQKVTTIIPPAASLSISFGWDF